MEAAAGLSEQLDKTSTVISNLKQEISVREEMLKSLQAKMLDIANGQVGKVDRDLVKNLVIGYTISDTTKKPEILKIIATVLDFNREERTKTGLDGGTALKNASETESVPLTGWTYWGDGKDRDDPHLRISPDQPPSCGEITITASGDAAAKQPECVGVYTPTQMFSAGRRVFKHQTQERYLLVTPGYADWGVQPSVETVGARMTSGCAPSLCPADPRARTNVRAGQTSWKYWGNREWKHGAITVKCSVHKY